MYAALWDMFVISDVRTKTRKRETEDLGDFSLTRFPMSSSTFDIQLFFSLFV